MSVPTKLPAGAHLRRSATASTSVIPAPTGGSTQSTWQVTYSGFDASSNANGPAAEAAFQAAVNIWSQIVASPVPIKVDADFAALPTGVLGSAGPSQLYTDGSGVYYASALADSLAGEDVSTLAGGPSEDIDAEFTSAAGADWYYGTDGNVPAGDVDFESVVLHELGHGLGFLGDMSVSGTTGGYQVPFAYDEETYNAATGGESLISYPNNSTALATALQSQSVYWGGPVAMQNDGGLRPKLYAPATWQSGSSYSHLDETTYPIGNANSLMTPAISDNEVIHNPGPITVGILIDEGWRATLPGLDGLPGVPTTVAASAGDGQADLSWSAPGSDGGSPITGYDVEYSTDASHWTSASSSFHSDPSTSQVVSGLTNGTSYVFRVAAINANGTGDYSPASLGVTPVASSAPSADASQLSAGPNQTVIYGHSATLTATLRDSATSAGLNAPVVLLARTGIANIFATLRSLAGSPSGALTAGVHPTVTTQYKFFFIGSLGHAGVYSSVVTVSVAPAVTAKLTKSKITHGHAPELYGAVTPAVAGTVVWLQRKSGSAWKTLSVHASEKTQTFPNGKHSLGYVLRIPTAKKGVASYRALVKASSTRVAGASAAKALHVS